MAQRDHLDRRSSRIHESGVRFSEEERVEQVRATDGPIETPASVLLPHFGTWTGDDFEECLEIVRRTRGKARF
jgi:hypothetical protein